MRRLSPWLTMVMVLAGLAAMPGCRNTLATAMYMIKGMNVDPDYDGLRDKRVAVVCRPVTDLEYWGGNVDKEIARGVAGLLGANVPKIKVVEPQKVEQWLDENMLEEDVARLGKALKADMVVAIDLEQFSLYQSQTIYQGKANATVKVHDCKANRVVFTKALPPSAYPPNVGVPTTDKQEAQFRAEFIRLLADQIGRHFYAHDPHADMALDAAALR